MTTLYGPMSCAHTGTVQLESWPSCLPCLPCLYYECLCMQAGIMLVDEELADIETRAAVANQLVLEFQRKSGALQEAAPFTQNPSHSEPPSLRTPLIHRSPI